jgi:hypothetical protein
MTDVEPPNQADKTPMLRKKPMGGTATGWGRLPMLRFRCFQSGKLCHYICDPQSSKLAAVERFENGG